MTEDRIGWCGAVREKSRVPALWFVFFWVKYVFLSFTGLQKHSSARGSNHFLVTIKYVV